VELPIRVPQAEHESRLGPIAGHAHDDAVCRADLLDLDLFALPGDVATLCTFGDNALQAGGYSALSKATSGSPYGPGWPSIAPS